jgi:hypothetical protein
MQSISDPEVWTVINALRLAGDAYAEDAGNWRCDEPVLAEQFDRQAVEVRELADRLEGDA